MGIGITTYSTSLHYCISQKKTDVDKLLTYNIYIQFQIRAEETESDEKLFDEKTLVITLKNWNDELPIFALEEYEVYVSEMIGLNEFVHEVRATDRDVGDFLT